jgi:hypothetical protein
MAEYEGLAEWCLGLNMAERPYSKELDETHANAALDYRSLYFT